MKNIFRVDKATNPFAQIDRRIFENPKLSWKAKGLLGYLLSRPDDWKVVMGDLVNRSTDGEEAVRTALSELQTTGHARREVLRDDDGTLKGTRWIITEEAMPVGVQAEMAISPTSEKPDAVNPPHTNKESTDKNFHAVSPQKEDQTSIEAQGFVEAFLKLLDETGATRPNLTPSMRSLWAKSYELMIRRDGRTKEQVWHVCKWARHDSFWSKNFLSPAKLRQKNRDQVYYFDVFLNLSKSNGRNSNQQRNPRSFGSNPGADYAGITNL